MFMEMLLESQNTKEKRKLPLLARRSGVLLPLANKNYNICSDILVVSFLSRSSVLLWTLDLSMFLPSRTWLVL